MNRFTYPQALWKRTALAVLTLFIVVLPVFGQGQEEKPQQDQQQPSIKIGTNLVTVPVIVTDRYGRFVTGLGRNQFIVREEGSQQKIEDFSSTEAPFSVALLIDTSRSTHNKLGSIRKAAETFIKQLLPNDRIMVVSFDDKVRFVCDFTSDHAELKRAVNSLKSNYATSLYDAIHLTINEKMSKIQGRKAIVVLTDGVDTASKQATWRISYSGLSGTPTAAHFHGPAQPGANAGVAVPIPNVATSPIQGSATLTDAQAADLLAGRYYINIHTAANPPGEIRGQVTK